MIYAPYDEFARGVKLAADEAGVSGKLRIYSADVSTSDIEAIRADGSPWVATAATNPAVVGAASVRTAALLIAGQPVQHTVLIKPVLITHDDLVHGDIHTVEELSAKLPAFGSSDASLASWIPTR